MCDEKCSKKRFMRISTQVVIWSITSMVLRKNLHKHGDKPREIFKDISRPNQIMPNPWLELPRAQIFFCSLLMESGRN
jgi:hypothetical protein